MAMRYMWSEMLSSAMDDPQKCPSIIWPINTPLWIGNLLMFSDEREERNDSTFFMINPTCPFLSLYVSTVASIQDVTRSLDGRVPPSVSRAYGKMQVCLRLHCLKMCTMVEIRVLGDGLMRIQKTFSAPVNPTCTFLLEVVTPGLTPSK